MANSKQFEKRINNLRLPWWFNVLKWGVPYTLAFGITMMLILALTGGIGIPESLSMLRSVDTLFLAMQPVVRLVAVTVTALSSFLSTLFLSSLVTRGFLFNQTEKLALKSSDLGGELFEKINELKHTLKTVKQRASIERSLKEVYQKQLEFLKGFAMQVQAGKINTLLTEGEGIEEPTNEEDKREESNLPRSSNVVMFSKKLSSPESGPQEHKEAHKEVESSEHNKINA